MAGLDWRNNSLKLLALLLALVLWVYVSNEQNPVREKLLTINLEHTGPNSPFVIVGGVPDSVKVRVQGNRNQLADLASVDFKAVITIPEGKTGDFSLPVQVTTPAGLRVSQIVPEEVKVSIDRIVEKQVPVAVSLRGTPAQGFTALAPLYQPPAVTVKGPSRDVNEISQVSAVVDIQNADRDVEQNTPLNVDASSVTLSPSSVRVVIPIIGAAASKTVSVQFQLTGSPATGYEVKRSYSEPATVQVLGPPEIISAITSIKTEPVDIEGADKNVTIEAGLIQPQGVTSMNPARVKVQVEIAKPDTPAPNGDDNTPKP